jgi:hypothetical protein
MFGRSDAPTKVDETASNNIEMCVFIT